LKRRDFVAALLSLATLEPVHAQQAGRVRRIGLLDPGLPHLFAAFREGMRDLGYVRSGGGLEHRVTPLAAHYPVGVI